MKGTPTGQTTHWIVIDAATAGASVIVNGIAEWSRTGAAAAWLGTTFSWLVGFAYQAGYGFASGERIVFLFRR